MTLSDDEMLLVMSFADGELEGDEAESARALVSANAEAKELVASLEAIGEGVRAAATTKTIDVSAGVMASLVPNDLDKARMKKHARTRAIAVVVTLTALAAGAYLYTRGEPEGGTTATQPASPTESPHVNGAGPSIVPSPVAVTPALATNETPGIQLDSVDTTAPVSVFYVSPTDDNSSTSSSVVVWIDDPAVGANK